MPSAFRQDHDLREHDPEPVAITGMAALYPQARGLDRFWRFTTEFAAPRVGAVPGRSGLDDIEVDPARFGIPPAQAGSMTRMQLLMLEAARQCLDDAGHKPSPQSGEHVDVVATTCFGLDRQYANATRIEAGRYIRDLERVIAAGSWSARSHDLAAVGPQVRAGLFERFGGSAHDRVGEMASTIPARIATAFKLSGRTFAVEAADAGSFIGLASAVTSLRSGTCEAVLLLAGQRHEGELTPKALRAKGLDFPLGEGIGALLLKRLSTARRDQDRIHALIRDVELAHQGRPGVFRYSSSPNHRRDLIACVEEAHADYVECSGPELAGTDEMLAALSPSVVVGSLRDRLGHTLANAGLAGVTRAALALNHRLLPPSARWPTPAHGNRTAVVFGASLTGTVGHVLLEEYAEQQVTVREPSPFEAIAVVGAAAHYAASPSLAAFWQNTVSGRDQIGPVPARLLDRGLYYGPGAVSLDRSYTDLAACVEVPDHPPEGIPITPSRQVHMDPAQRLALHVASQLFRTVSPPGRGIVAVGTTLCLTTERQLAADLALPSIETLVEDNPALQDLPPEERAVLIKLVRERFRDPLHEFTPNLLDGYLASGVAALIANEFRLAAVPVAVEAACASTLAAVDLAVGALRSGEVDFAVAGGVELPSNHRDMVLCSALGLLSHSRITPFDAEADGFTPGDGCALFLLKRYQDAVRDGDAVLGLLRGIGASNDSKSLIAPDVGGQVKAMNRAFGQVDFRPADVGYLEAHGTGTKVGDQVEITATAQVYAGRAEPLRIGSAKSFFGHTFAAAGGAGLLRALQAVRVGTFPPTANLRRLNPELDLAAIPAVVPTAAEPWTGADRPRRAAVSSFGTGGINYHLLIEEHR